MIFHGVSPIKMDGKGMQFVMIVNGFYANKMRKI